MKSFNKYLMHRLKSTFFLTLALCILAAIIMSVSVSMWVGNFYEWIDYTKESITLSEEELKDPFVAAEYLTNRYDYYTWTKE